MQADKQSGLITRLLQVSRDPNVKPPVVFLKSADGIPSAQMQLLNMVDIDEIFIDRLSMSDCKSLRSQLILLLGYVDRCDSELGRSGMPPEHFSVCSSLLSVVQRYISTVIQCPELFGHPASTLHQSGETVSTMMHAGDCGVLQVVRICDIVMNEGGTLDFPRPVIMSIVNKIIATRSFDICSDQASGDVNSLALFLRQCKAGTYVSEIIRTSPIFLPTNLPTPMKISGPPATHKNVFLLQTGTLLGRLLMPSTVDHVLLPAQDLPTKSAKHLNFSNLSRRSVPDFNASVAQVRAQLSNVIDGALSVIEPLIRANESTRLETLSWMSTAIKNSASRSTMGWQQQMAPHGAQLAEHLSGPQAAGASSLERFRMMTTMQSVRLGGLLSSGTCLNLAWTIFELCKPIKLGVDIDPFHCITGSALIGSLDGEARLGDADRVAAVAAPAPATFKSQIVWLAVSAIHTLVLPSSKEAEMCIQCASVFHRDKKDVLMNDAYGEFHCFESVFNHPRFLESLAHVINLILGLVLKCALNNAPMDIRRETSVLSDSLAVLPSCMMDELVEVLDFYRQMRDVGGRGGTKIVDLLDADLFIQFSIWTLGSDQMKNPSIRGKAAKVLIGLAKEPKFAMRIEQAEFSVRNILPACIRVFSAVEKTKQSYYDIRMHVKFELRIPIQQLFEILLNFEPHRNALKSFVEEYRDEFYKFASQLLNDTTYLLEEGVETLIAIRQGTAETAESSGGTAGLGVDRGVEEGDQNDAGEDMYRRSRHDPKEHCKQYMRMGHQTMSTLHQMCKQTCDILVDDQVVLDQMISCCLDPSLDRLVGPKCLQLKGQSGDFALFEFDPKRILNQIIEMYVYLARRAKERVAKALSEDKRYYRPETLRKAVMIARREHLVLPEMLKEFEEFVKFVNEFATNLQNVMDSVEIPDEFLDPIMAEIMVDPVLLPSSNNIMDRRHIMRIIMSDDHDPFNRQPLKPADLVPQTDLKTKIHAFCKENNIPLDLSSNEHMEE